MRQGGIKTLRKENNKIVEEKGNTNEKGEGYVQYSAQCKKKKMACLLES